MIKFPIGGNFLDRLISDPKLYTMQSVGTFDKSIIIRQMSCGLPTAIDLSFS